MSAQIAEGEYTSTIYGWIKDGEYDKAIQVLQNEMQNFPRSRAALSMLAYCYYYAQDFANAAKTYEKLLAICPDAALRSASSMVGRRVLTMPRCREVSITGDGDTMEAAPPWHASPRLSPSL